VSVGHPQFISQHDEGLHRLVMLSSAMSGFADLMRVSIEASDETPTATLHEWQALTEVLAHEAVAICNVLDRARMQEPSDPAVLAATEAIRRKTGGAR